MFWFNLHIKRCTTSLHSQCNSMSWSKRLKRSSQNRTADWGRTFEPWRTETSVCVFLCASLCHCWWCAYDVILHICRTSHKPAILKYKVEPQLSFLIFPDLASEEKKRLEEKQRAARKNRSKSDDEWKTRCRNIILQFCIFILLFAFSKSYYSYC